MGMVFIYFLCKNVENIAVCVAVVVVIIYICERIWEKGPYGAKNFFGVINTIVFYDI